MTDQPRTPPWWRALPSWAQVLILSTLLPGVVAHEFTHALVAGPWGTWDFDWDDIAVEVTWQTNHPAPRIASHVAPLVAGYAFAVGALAVVLGMPRFSMHAGLLAWISVNWLVFTVASIPDVRNALEAIVVWRARGKANDI